MKTLNIKKGQFAGKVLVHGKTIYIDTSNGTGFQQVFEGLGGIIHNFALRGQYCFGSMADAKQEVCLAMLEGMLKYDPEKGASLSTFLYVVGNNRIIDKQIENIRGKAKYTMMFDEADIPNKHMDPNFGIELRQRIKSWDDRWKHIMLCIYINGDSISDVAKAEGFTPWGLTRAIRRKLKEARKV